MINYFNQTRLVSGEEAFKYCLGEWGGLGVKKAENH